MQEQITNFIKLNNKIFRLTQIHLDKVLKEYELSSGSYPYLFFLNKCEGISQNRISKELGYDKAMSARIVKKLVQLGYIDRRQDADDSRAYRLYLTDKAKKIVPVLMEEIQLLIEGITADINEGDKEITITSLNKILTSITEKTR